MPQCLVLLLYSTLQFTGDYWSKWMPCHVPDAQQWPRPTQGGHLCSPKMWATEDDAILKYLESTSGTKCSQDCWHVCLWKRSLAAGTREQETYFSLCALLYMYNLITMVKTIIKEIFNVYVWDFTCWRQNSLILSLWISLRIKHLILF